MDRRIRMLPMVLGQTPVIILIISVVTLPILLEMWVADLFNLGLLPCKLSLGQQKGRSIQGKHVKAKRGSRPRWWMPQSGMSSLQNLSKRRVTLHIPPTIFTDTRKRNTTQIIRTLLGIETALSQVHYLLSESSRHFRNGMTQT